MVVNHKNDSYPQELHSQDGSLFVAEVLATGSRPRSFPSLNKTKAKANKHWIPHLPPAIVLAYLWPTSVDSLHTYYVPGTVLDAGESAGNKRDQSLPSMSLSSGRGHGQ